MLDYKVNARDWTQCLVYAWPGFWGDTFACPTPQDGSSLSLCSETLTVIMVDVSVPWVLSVDVIRLWIPSHQTLGLV